MSFSLFVQQFHFLRPAWLLLIVPFIGLIYLRYKADNESNTWQKKLPSHLAKALIIGKSTWHKNLPIKVLALLGIVAVLIASGPSWQRQPSPFAEDTSPLVIVLDLSSSMIQQDIAPNRLFRAKQKILDLLALRNSGKTALIVYSGSAHIAMPLTQDIAVFRPLIDALNPAVIPRQGKFSEYSLPLIDTILGENTQNSTVLLITDALNKRGNSAFQSYFSKHNYQLLILGVGNLEVPVAQPLEQDNLNNLASNTNGFYTTFTQNKDDIEQLVAHISVHAMMNEETSQPWFDSGYYLIWLIILPYLLWFRKGWLVQWSVLLVFSFSTLTPSPVSAKEWQFSDLWLTADQQGQWYFEQQDYQQAAEHYDNATSKGAAYYMAGEYKLAQNYFLRDDSLTAQLGVAASLAHQHEYMAAKNLYKSILLSHPKNEVAQHNLQLLENIIKQIDQFTDSQKDNTEKQSSKALGDKPQTSEGVRQEVDKKQLITDTLSAEQILNNEKMNEKWMKRVDSDLGIFLANKFSTQLALGLGTQAIKGLQSDQNTLPKVIKND